MTKRRFYEDYYFTSRLGIICLIGFLLLVMAGQIKRTEPRQIISPVPITKAQEITEVLPTPTPVLGEKEQIIQEIVNVFGEHSEKAFLLLLGKDNKSCAENRTLNPKAVNDNTWWGGVGRDCGVFQINDYYHPYTCEELKDWKLNINYAWRMFKNNNYQFSRRACGLKYGI